MESGAAQAKREKSQNRRRIRFRFRRIRFRFRRIRFRSIDFSADHGKTPPAVDRAPLSWYNGGIDYTGRKKWKQTN